MRCLIVDDEPVAREILRTYIVDTQGLVSAGECEDAMQAIDRLQQESVDVLFLDVNMPKLSGIGLLKSLDVKPQVILTTAYSEYALESYELNVTDYLLKPFSFERFLKAVQKARERIKTTSETKQASIIIKSDGRTFRVPATDILYLESSGDYVIIHTTNERYTVYDRLKNMLSELPEPNFIQVHKSYAVNIRRIDYLEGNRISVAGQEIPIGKSYKPGFLSVFEGI